MSSPCRKFGGLLAWVGTALGAILYNLPDGKVVDLFDKITEHGKHVETTGESGSLGGEARKIGGKLMKAIGTHGKTPALTARKSLRSSGAWIGAKAEESIEEAKKVCTKENAVKVCARVQEKLDSAMKRPTLEETMENAVKAYRVGNAALSELQKDSALSKAYRVGNAPPGRTQPRQTDRARGRTQPRQTTPAAATGKDRQPNRLPPGRSLARAGGQSIIS